MPRASRERVILDMLAEIGHWQPFVGPTGARLFRAPTSTGIGTYTVSPTSCTCPADQYRKRGQLCKHRQVYMLATKVYEAMRSHEESLCPDVSRMLTESNISGRTLIAMDHLQKPGQN